MSMRQIRGPFDLTAVKRVTSGNYTVVNDSIVIVNKTVGAPTTITLPPSNRQPTDGVRGVWIVDGKGDSNTNPITITPAGSDAIQGEGENPCVLSDPYGTLLLFDLGSGSWVVAI